MKTKKRWLFRRNVITRTLSLESDRSVGILLARKEKLLHLEQEQDAMNKHGHQRRKHWKLKI